MHCDCNTKRFNEWNNIFGCWNDKMSLHTPARDYYIEREPMAEHGEDDDTDEEACLFIKWIRKWKNEKIVFLHLASQREISVPLSAADERNVWCKHCPKKERLTTCGTFGIIHEYILFIAFCCCCCCRWFWHRNFELHTSSTDRLMLKLIRGVSEFNECCLLFLIAFNRFAHQNTQTPRQSSGCATMSNARNRIRVGKVRSALAHMVAWAQMIYLFAVHYYSDVMRCAHPTFARERCYTMSRFVHSFRLMMNWTFVK